MPRDTALGYLRLSGVESDELSPDIQLKRILQLAREQGLALEIDIDLYRDTDKGMHSARKRTNIPQWYALYQRALTDPRVAAIYIYDLRRGFRSVKHLIQEAEALNAAGVKIMRAKGGEIDMTTAEGRKRAIDEVNAAEFESRITTERLKEHYDELRELDVYFSHHSPIGLQRQGTKHKVVWTADANMPSIVALCRIYGEGNSPKEVTKSLAEYGVTWTDKNGVVRPFVLRTVEKVIRRLEIYKPFLSPEVYADALFEREQRSHPNYSKRRAKYKPLLLKGVLICSRCGAHLTATYARNRQGEYLDIYRHRNSAPCPSGQQQIAAKFLDADFRIEFDDYRRQFAVDNEAFVQAILATNPPESTPVSSARREQLARTLEGLEDMMANKLIKPERFRERQSKILAELESLPEASPRNPHRVTEAEARLHASQLQTRLQETLTNETVRRYVVSVKCDGRTLKDIDWRFAVPVSP